MTYLLLNFAAPIAANAFVTCIFAGDSLVLLLEHVDDFNESRRMRRGSHDAG